MDPTDALILTPIVVYIISVVVWPYARCRSCRRSGQSVGSNEHRWGVCRRCDGTGQRVRFGTRLLGRR